MAPSSHSAPKWISALFAALLPGLLLSGCSLLPSNQADHVQEPPLIPEPSVDASALQQSEMNRKPMILAYADLIDFNDMTKYNPLLHEAVSTAIKLGVLKPASLDEAFNPQNPIHYGEFRTWTIAYQNVSSGNVSADAQAQPTQSSAGTGTSGSGSAANPAETHPTETSLATPAPTTADPMNPANLMILPSEMQWGDHRLVEIHPVTREELCALYVFLTRQEAAARSLNVDAIESTTPGQKQTEPDAINLDEALSQFKDWSAMDAWARRYVAIAYRDGLLKSVFGLTPNRLTVDEGFHPQQPLTREEAIVFLHGLYGHTALARQTLQTPSHPSNLGAGAAQPDGGGTATALHDSSDMPKPISSLKTMQERGPNGSRSAMQVNGPE